MSLVWSDARRWVGRTLVVVAFPWLVLTSGASNQVSKGDAPAWLVVLPTVAVLVACAVAAPLGIVRARRMRAVSGVLDWEFSPRFMWPYPIPTKLFPFDGWGRRIGDGASGVWDGHHAAVATIGARTTVVAVWVHHLLPTLQLVPKALSQTLDAGKGATMSAELASLQKKWRVISSDSHIAHAALPPTSLSALESFKGAPIIAFDNALAWTTDPGVRLDPEQVAARLELLVELADRMPAFVRPPAGVTWAPTAFFSGTREHNLNGRLSILLPFTLVGAPLGVWFGIRGLRACREGSADNRRTSLAGIVLSCAMTLFLVWAVLHVIIEESGRR